MLLFEIVKTVKYYFLLLAEGCLFRSWCFCDEVDYVGQLMGFQF